MTNPIEVAARALIPYSGASTNRELQARKTFESIDVDDLAAVILAHYQRSDGLDVTAFETAEAVKAHLTGRESTPNRKGAGMTISQAAIDAAADAVHEAADGQGLPEHPVNFATAALEAAMPHLRKQIAEEIRAHIPCPLEPRATQAESLIDAGIFRAARIAETGAEQ